MAYGAVKHSPKKIKAAFWRGRGGKPVGMAAAVSIKVEIGRSMRQRLPTWQGGKGHLPRSLGPGYAARACIGGAGRSSFRKLRCAYAEGRSPTLAFKLAVKRLLKKTR